MWDPIQSQMTGSPSHSIRPPRNIRAIRPACVSFLLIPIPSKRPPADDHNEVRESPMWPVRGERQPGDVEEDLSSLREADRQRGGTLPTLSLSLPGEVEPPARRPRDGDGLPAL